MPPAVHCHTVHLEHKLDPFFLCYLAKYRLAHTRLHQVPVMMHSISEMGCRLSQAKSSLLPSMICPRHAASPTCRSSFGVVRISSRLDRLIVISGRWRSYSGDAKIWQRSERVGISRALFDLMSRSTAPAPVSLQDIFAQYRHGLKRSSR